MSDKVQKGAQTGEIMNPDDAEQYQSEEVMAKTAERLKALGGNPPPVVKSVKSQEADVAGDTPTPDESDTDTAGDDKPQDTDGDSDTTDGEQENQDEAPVIPDKLYRAAVHSEWTPEQITDFWKKAPELAQKTLEKLHKDMINTNNVYAEQGRAVTDIRKQQTQQDVPAQAQTPQRKDVIDLQKAEEEFGSGAAAIMKQLNDVILDLTSKPQQQQTVAPDTAARKVDSASQEKSLAIVQQMGGWFADAGLEPFNEFYGSGRDANGLMLLTSDHITPAQRENREKLLNLAADIETGVGLRAGTISVSDAMTRAHLILTKDMQVEMVRKDIMKKAKKRASGVTLRPNGQKITPKEKLKPGEKISEKQVVANAAKRLAQLQAGKKLT